MASGALSAVRIPVSLSTIYPTPLPSQMSLSTALHLLPTGPCPHLSTCIPSPCHLQMDDAGRYQCLASNEMGAVKKVVTLVLQSEFQLCH